MKTKGRDERERAVVEFWQRGHLSWSTIQVYLGWVRRFRTYCFRRELIEADQLCLVGVRHFTRAYTGPRLLENRITRRTCDTARNDSRLGLRFARARRSGASVARPARNSAPFSFVQ